jgi:hypothetical protein
MCKLSSRRYWRMVSRPIRTLVPRAICICRRLVLVKRALTESNIRYLSCAGVVARCLPCPGRLTWSPVSLSRCLTQEMVGCASARWEYPSPANVATSTHSSQLKFRETRFIMTKTCDFLQIASKTIQIMIQFDQKGQSFTVRVNTAFLTINKQRQAIY